MSFSFCFVAGSKKKTARSRSLCWRALFCAAVPPPAYPPQSSGGGFLSGLARTVVQGTWSAIEYLSRTFVGTLCSTWGLWAFSMGFLAIHRQPIGSQPVRLKCRVWSVRNNCANELRRCRQLSSLLAESTNGFRWPVLCTVHAGHRLQGFLEAEHDDSRRASHQSVHTLPVRGTRAYWKIGDCHRERGRSRSSFAPDVTEGSPQTSGQSGSPRSCMLPCWRNSPQAECVTANTPRNCTMATALRF